MSTRFLKLILFAAVFTFSQNGISQQTNTYTPQQYELLKSSGSLPAGNHIISLPPPNLGVVPAQERGGSGSCGCYVEPDGTYTLAMAPNDDGSTGSIALPFTFCLYGDNYTSLYINNNGNVSFGSPYGTFSASAFPAATYTMVAPFWGDVDTRTGGQVWYKITPTAIYVNWVNVGYYSQHTDKLNTFQLILTDGTDPVLQNGDNVAFCYKEMQWTTGDASQGVNGFGGVPATVGSNRGNGTDFVQFGRFDQPGGAYDGPFGNPDGIDWLDFATFKFNTCVIGSNIAPILSSVSPSSANGSGSGIACGDTLNICGVNDTLILSASFIAPENGQSITITASAPTLSNFQVIGTTPAPNASITMMVISDPADAGFNQIDITATDNGTPPLSTTFPITIFIDTTGLSLLNPDITGPDFACPNSTVVLDAGSGYDSYLWDSGETTSTISTSDTGSHYVTVELNGCFASTFHDLGIFPGAIPVIVGDSMTCAPDMADLTTSQPYVTYLWSTGSSNSTISVPVGSYTVTVTDTNGCTGTSAPFDVTTLVLYPVITGAPLICANATTPLTTTVPFFGYQWSNSSTSPVNNVGAGTYTVTVSDSLGCSGTSAPFTIGISDPTPAISGVPVICPDDMTTLTCDPGYDAYLWSNNDVNVNTNVPIGSYFVIVTDSLGCMDTAYFTVGSYPAPIPGFGFIPPSGTAFPMDSVYFIDSTFISGGNIVSWSWSFGDGDSSTLQNPVHYYDVPGVYSVTLTVTTADGCTETITLLYEVIPQTVVVPNVITPNSTPGSNDFFVVTNLQYFPNSTLSIFDRWGKMVYESTNYQNNWDGTHYKTGKKLSDGTYYYILHVMDTDGTIYNGTVTILN